LSTDGDCCETIVETDAADLAFLALFFIRIDHLHLSKNKILINNDITEKVFSILC
jgi:hypothetical protein